MASSSSSSGSSSAPLSSPLYLLKSEPHRRLEKGHDVSYGFCTLLREPTLSTTWEGVRNPVAGKILRGMSVGQRAFWYHSNVATPGIVGVVEVVEEALVDPSAAVPGGPYEDAKWDETRPRWFMPRVRYVSTLPHPVPLALLNHLADKSKTFLSTDQASDLPYLSQGHLDAIAEMDLLRLKRLSVQRVQTEAWEAVILLGHKGGWTSWEGKIGKEVGGTGEELRELSAKVDKDMPKGGATKVNGTGSTEKKRGRGAEEQEEPQVETKVKKTVQASKTSPPSKTKQSAKAAPVASGRRSTRSKK